MGRGRTAESHKRNRLIKLLLERNDDGTYRYGQRELQSMVSLARNTIRKIAVEVGRDWEVHGVDIRPPIWMCFNCSGFFRRSPSKQGAAATFCSPECKASWQSKEKSVEVSNFNRWLDSREYNKTWRERILANKGVCEVSGLSNDLEVHHIIEDRSRLNPMACFESDSGIVLNKGVKDEIFALMKNRIRFDDAVAQLKVKYGR